MGTPDVILIIIASAVGLGFFIGIIYVFAGPVSRGVGWVLRRIGTFIKSMVTDVARIVAGFILVPVFGMLAAVSLVFVQIPAARRFAAAAKDEVVRLGLAFYRIVFAHPARLFGLEAAVDTIETRVPGVLSGTWGDAISPRTALFPGYAILSTLPGGGSGARLYITEPSEKKRREFAREFGLPIANTIDRVVIKSFSTIAAEGEGTLPQLVRESQGLEAGKRLGLILDHGLTAERFWYAMRYVPGNNLRVVTTSMHQQSPDALSPAQLARVLRYTRDLLETLTAYHAQGLWHKDVKPDNVIIEPLDTGRDIARLVDLGLVSSLRSAMTLTTHGTEYYRDPEMVRLALRGAKVHEVDGAKFDIYAVGAVLFSMLEDSFPAQGVLSPLRKPSPPIVQWIVRRAMADYHQRYHSAQEMFRDVAFLLEQLAENVDLSTLPPHRLPSVQAAAPADALPPAPLPVASTPSPTDQSVPAPLPPPSHTAATSELARRPPAESALVPALPATATRAAPLLRVRVTNWWSGKYEITPADPGPRA